MNITLIAAIGAHNELGKNNQLIWHIPEDLKFFKENTIHKPIVMGMNTFQSLPKLLPHRKHIVLTHQEVDLDSQITIVHNMEELLIYIQKLNQEVMVIGGSQVYQQMFPYANKILLTKIEKSDQEADAFFPNFNEEEWEKNLLSENQYEDIKYKHLVYKR